MPDNRIGPVTDRLVLRAMEVEDAEVYCALKGRPEVTRFTIEPPIGSVEAAREMIANYPDFDTVGYGRWGCILKQTGKTIGFCGLKYLDDLDEVDIGYRFLPDYWGQGLATEACQASIDFGFKTLKLPRIIGLVMAENVASRHVLEKVGFHLDGEMLIYGQHALMYDIER